MSVSISVIIPVYNAERYIRECIHSVLIQRGVTVEVICVDDGSCDSSIDIISELQHEYEQIRLIKQKNRGAGVARNIGLEHVSGEFVAFLDADDYYYHSDVLNHMYEYACKNDSVVCGANLIYFLDGEYQNNCVEPRFSFNNKKSFGDNQDIYGFTRYIYRRQFLIDYDISFPNTRYFEDPVFLFNVMKRAEHFSTIPDIMYVYRYEERWKNYSKDNIYEWIRGIKYILSESIQLGYYKVYKCRIKSLLHGAYFYKILSNVNGLSDREWDVFEEIYKIEKTIDPDCELISKEFIDNTIGEAFNHEKEVLRFASECSKIIIYGAGKNAKYFYDKYQERIDNMIGFAVTSAPELKDLKGLPVRQLTDYQVDNAIIIAANEKNRIEMTEFARKNGFSKILCVDTRKLSVINY